MFLTGSPRSGTTLLAALLATQPGICVPNESGFLLGPLHQRRWHRPGARWELGADAFVRGARSDPRLARWGLDPPVWSELARAPGVSDLRDLMGTAYESYAHAQGARFVVDKTPQLVLFLDTLAAGFPGAALVHLVRDGRDVALSWLDGDWGVSTVAEAAHRWDLQNRRAVRASRRLGGRYQRIRYEDLVVQPERTVGGLTVTLGVPLDAAAMSDGDRSTAMERMARPEYHRHLTAAPTVGLRDWAKDMAPADVHRFELIAGRTLRQLGYPCQAPTLAGRAHGAVLRASVTARRAARRARSSLDRLLR